MDKITKRLSNTWNISRLDEFIKRYVPPLYRDFRLKLLQPSNKSRVPLKRQQEILDMIRANPGGSYAFFGPPGTSKTTICTALFIHMLELFLESPQAARSQAIKYFPIIRISAKALLDQFTDYAMHKHDILDPDSGELPVSMPVISRERVVHWTNTEIVRPHLFLEEIDKIKETESRRTNLFEVVDAIYEHKGQLVVNTNMTPAEFGQVFGPDFARRIGEMCTVVNLFEEKS